MINRQVKSQMENGIKKEAKAKATGHQPADRVSAASQPFVFEHPNEYK